MKASTPVIDIVTLLIPGAPVPWKRPGVNRDRIFYNRQVVQSEMFKLHVEQQFKRQPFDKEPLLIDITFFMPIANDQFGKYHNVYCTTTPDCDNLVKFVLDSLQGVAFVDDKLVVELYARKVWSRKPQTEIIIKPLTDSEGKSWNKETVYTARTHTKRTVKRKSTAP